jgi:hypothetical protein
MNEKDDSGNSILSEQLNPEREHAGVQSSKKMEETMKQWDWTQQQVWKDFTTYPNTFEQVKQLLNQGKIVVVVLISGAAACVPYQDNYLETAWNIKDKMVHASGQPLDIGPDGLPRFAFLTWKSTDPIHRPVELGVVSVCPPGVRQCKHTPTLLVVECFPELKTVGEPQALLCKECAELYHSTTKCHDLAAEIGLKRLAPSYMFIPLQDIIKEGGAFHSGQS